MSEETGGHQGLSDILSMPKMSDHSNWVRIYFECISEQRSYSRNKQLLLPSKGKQCFLWYLKRLMGDFPRGTVVKNLPASAGDTGSSPGPGRSHMPQSNRSRVPQLLSLRSRAHKPQLLKPICLEPVLHNKRSHCSEKPAHRNEE